MNIILALKRPFIWLSRVRHRCGYGVFPFAFELITCLSTRKLLITLIRNWRRKKNRRGIMVKDGETGLLK